MKWSLGSIIVLTFFVSMALSESENNHQNIMKPSWEANALLPQDVRPESYHLFLHPDINGGTFQGKVSISLDVTQPKDHFIVHTKDLKVSKAEVINTTSSENVSVKDSFEYSQNEFWVVTLMNSIPPGKYKLNLEFSGSLVDKIVGFYRSSYIAPDKSQRYIVTTKFEPTYARLAFPCLDEPGFKAKYYVELVKPSTGGYIALSNMNQISEVVDSPSPGLTTVKFDETPPMSSYLACFIVCDFESIHPPGKTSTGTTINVYARPGQINNMRFALDLAVSTMNYYTEYFAIDFPLPKLDLIAIPDFVSGAMENWGLITFRETSVLISEGGSSLHDYSVVSSTVCHELAHMWFGDLVTMKWWDDLWLNEGFATFMAIKALMHIKPEYNAEILGLLQSMNQVLSEDAALSSHPIIQPVYHPNQITEIFDVISYVKGSAVLRMLEDLSISDFREGLSIYLNKHLLGSAKTDDLWDSLQTVMTKTNISRFMGTWTKQMGYPVVNVSRTEGGLTLTQERFLRDVETKYNPDESPYQYKWEIAVSYITSESPEKIESLVFNLDKKSVDIALPSGVSWYKLNCRQMGFYRVNYPKEDWEKLAAILKENPEALSSVEDRCNLIEDSFSLAASSRLGYHYPLHLISYINKETHFGPWKVAHKHLSDIKALLEETDVSERYKSYVRKIVEPNIHPDLWNISDSTNIPEVMRKTALLALACKFEVPAALDKASSLLMDYLDGKSPKPNIEIRSLVYMYGQLATKESVWDKLWELYRSETAPQEINKFMTALAFSREPEKLKRLLEYAKNESYIRRQDYMSILILISHHPVGNGIVWDYIRNEWEYIVERFTLNDRRLGLVIPAIAEGFATEERLQEMKTFFAKYPESGAGAAGRKKALEKIENNIKWRQKNLKVVNEFLNSTTIHP